VNKAKLPKSPTEALSKEKVADFKERYWAALTEYVDASERYATASADVRASLAKIHSLEHDLVAVLTGVPRILTTTGADDMSSSPRLTIDIGTMAKIRERLAQGK
jgi:hypothetical protein